MKTGELARLLDAEISGSGEVEVTGVQGVSDLVEGCLTFLARKKFLPEIAASPAAAVLVSDFQDELSHKVQLRVANPQLAFARALELFYVRRPEPKGVMEGACVENGAEIGNGATVYPLAYVCRGAVIGVGSVIHPHVFIGEDSRIGKNCVIYPGVKIRERVTIGDSVIIHSNSVIGADGYGYVTDGGVHHKIPQVGTVHIGNNVEIGANVTIDRATTGTTSIGEGTKIDNLVQIAHNVTIGKHCLIIAQVGIAGSTVIGDYVVLGGQVGVADHVTVESGTMVGAQSGLMGVVKKGIYTGTPAINHRQWLKAQAVFERLPELMKTVKRLEDKVKELEVKDND